MKLKELKEVLKSYDKVLIGLGTNTYNNIPIKETITNWNEIINLKNQFQDSEPINNPIKKLIANKDCFIISSAWDSNLDLEEIENLYTPNGSIDKLQCYEACSQELWNFNDFINGKDIPRCPYCNSPLVLNIKTDAFFINSHLKVQENNYYKWIHQNYEKSILIIEIESDEMDRRIIRQSFENISAALPNTFFLRVNSSYLEIPKSLKKSGSIKAKPLNFFKLIS